MTMRVVIARCRSNRVFYQSPTVEKLNKKRGCPKKYGERFDLGDAETWHSPDETNLVQQTTRKGRVLNVTIQAWHQMLMRGYNFRKKMGRLIYSKMPETTRVNLLLSLPIF